MQYSLLKRDRILLGLVIQNIGSRMKFVSEENSLPMTIRGGIGYKILDSWIIEADAILPNDNTIIFGAGTQFVLKVDKEWSITPRVGYNTRTVSDLTDLKGLTCGFGFNWQSVSWKDMAIDYALVPYGKLGLTHRISLGMKF